MMVVIRGSEKLLLIYFHCQAQFVVFPPSLTGCYSTEQVPTTNKTLLKTVAE